MHNFPSRGSQVNFSDKDWEPWAQHPECERNFPAAARSKLSSFQRVLVTQVFRPERIQSSLNLFICEALGLTSLSGQPFSFKSTNSNELSPDVPCLFVVSAGSDPSAELQEFSEAEVGKDNLIELSMGGNQND